MIAFALNTKVFKVETDSRQLSVTALSPSGDLVVVYEDPSREINIMYGYYPPDSKAISWRNVSQYCSRYCKEVFWNVITPLTIACSADPFHSDIKALYCFRSNDNKYVSMLTFSTYSITSSGNLTVDDKDFGD